MENVQVVINPTLVKSINYSDAMNVKPGSKVELKVKQNINIVLDPVNPLAARVYVSYRVDDDTFNSFSLDIETVSTVVVSSYLDHLDEMIRKIYMPNILMAVNEKVRSVTALLGKPVIIPNPRIMMTNDRPTDANESGSSLLN